MSKKFKKASCVKKNAKVCGVEVLKNILLQLETTVAYCHTLEEVPRLLRLEKPNNKKFQKTWKNASFIKKIAKFSHIKNWKLFHGQ